MVSPEGRIAETLIFFIFAVVFFPHRPIDFKLLFWFWFQSQIYWVPSHPFWRVCPELSLVQDSTLSHSLKSQKLIFTFEVWVCSKQIEEEPLFESLCPMCAWFINICTFTADCRLSHPSISLRLLPQSRHVRGSWKRMASPGLHAVDIRLGSSGKNHPTPLPASMSVIWTAEFRCGRLLFEFMSAESSVCGLSLLHRLASFGAAVFIAIISL